MYLKDPEGRKQEVKATKNNDKKKTYSAVYYPTAPGDYEVTLSYHKQKKRESISLQKSLIHVSVGANRI